MIRWIQICQDCRFGIEQTEPDTPRMQDLRRYRQNQIYTKFAGPRIVQTESDAQRLQDLGR